MKSWWGEHMYSQDTAESCLAHQSSPVLPGSVPGFRWRLCSLPERPRSPRGANQAWLARENGKEGKESRFPCLAEPCLTFSLLSTAVCFVASLERSVPVS